LKIKSFLGTTQNAVEIQLYTALLAILLLKYQQFRSTQDWSLSNLICIIRLHLFSHIDLMRLINRRYLGPLAGDNGTPSGRRSLF
jgi:hypothetical protein